MIIEGPGDRIEGRVLGADVDVKSLFDIEKRSPKENILAILRVGNYSGARMNVDTSR